MHAVETHGLSKRFGQQAAVEGVDLTVPAGAVYGFLGPNGAGKTTTIRMALGLLKPSAGNVSVFGHDVGRERMKTSAAIGSMVEVPALYDRLTGRENIEVGRQLVGAPKSDTDRVLELVGLTAAAGRLAGRYSQGMRQRLGLARALLGQPKLLVLDEPTNGLDPDGIREVRDLIRTVPASLGMTVFVSSHLLAEVEQMATHVGVMHKGRLVVQGTLDELKGGGDSRMFIACDDAVKAAFALQSANPALDGGQPALTAAAVSGRLEVTATGQPMTDALAASVNRMLVKAGIGVFGIERPHASLEDIYLKITGGQGGDR